MEEKKLVHGGLDKQTKRNRKRQDRMNQVLFLMTKEANESTIQDR